MECEIQVKLPRLLIKPIGIEVHFYKQEDLMKKSDTDLADNIILTLNGEEILSIPVIEAYSWGYNMEKQDVLINTIDYIKKWYQEQGNIKNVMSNIRSLWDTLTDYVAEKNVQDFIDQGVLNYSKETALIVYNDNKFMKPFMAGLKYITDYWMDLSIDEAQKQAYREARKGNRARLMSINFGGGLLGGLHTLASAGLANIASEMTHSAVNAIGNGMDNISKNNKLDNFFNEDDSLNSLIDGWSESFWLIIDEHIDLIHSVFGGKIKKEIMIFSCLIERKQSAENIFNNMNKIKNLTDDDYTNAIEECLIEFPFEIKYWAHLMNIMSTNYIFNIKMVNFFDPFFAQLGNYVDGLYDELEYTMINVMMIRHANFVQKNEHDSARSIAEALDEKLEDNEFREIFDMCVTERIMLEENADKDIIRGLFNLLYTLKNIDIDDYKNDEEIKEQFDNKQHDIAFDFVEKENYFILKEFKKGNIDTVAEAIKKEMPTVNSERVLGIITYILSKEMEKGELVPTKELIKKIENLYKALAVNFKQNKRHSCDKLEEYVNNQEAVKKMDKLPIEARIEKFYNFVDQAIKEVGEVAFGNKAYWGNNLTLKKISNAKDSMKIDDNAKVLFIFDDTILGSGKAGFVITSNGIVNKDRESGFLWTMNWKEIIDESEVTHNKRYDRIVFKNKETNKEKFEHSITFTDNGPNINKKVLAILIREACEDFYGVRPEVNEIER
jgi:hypothetical protein